jgi:mono/diheme cytochrome c family protein
MSTNPRNSKAVDETMGVRRVPFPRWTRPRGFPPLATGGAGGVLRARLSRGSTAAVFVLALVLLSGCRSEMYNQARYEPLEPSEFFEDGASARPLVAGTVARDDPRGGPPPGAAEDVFYSGWEKGKLAETVPFPVDRAVLERGQERYRIYCIPCHGESGDGRGIIVRRGFNPPPPYFSGELLHQPIGHFFDVMTRGYGTMYSYAARVPPRDRWAIAAYIRVLQLSQHAVVADLPAEDRNQLPGGEGSPTPRAQP